MAHNRRRVLHFNVTEFPSAAWTAQQTVEAFPEDTAPRFMIRDRDGIFGDQFRRRIQGLGIEEILTCAINERMQRKLDYTQEEVRILKEVLRTVTGTARISFTADQRRRLALAGKELNPDERRKYCHQIVRGAQVGSYEGTVRHVVVDQKNHRALGRIPGGKERFPARAPFARIRRQFREGSGY